MQPVVSQESAERARIASERAAQLKDYEQMQSACYQKLAVNDCLTQARDVHNEKMRDLKRQDVALNDVQRKSKAAERMRAVDERNSPQAQLKLAERRGRAIEDTKQRQMSQAARQTAHDAKNSAANTGTQNSTAVEPALQESKPLTNQTRAESKPKLPVTERPGQADKTAKSQQAAAQRERDAAERKARAQQREANRKKPAAASLPVPQ